MLPEAALTSFIAALFSTTNPLGNLGLFVGLTAHRPPEEVRGIAWRCAAAVAIALLVFAWTGSVLLAFFGVTVDALRAAGGVIVLLIGLSMLSNRPHQNHSDDEMADGKARPSIAIVPLAIPIVAGPGALSTVLVAAQQHQGVISQLEHSVVILAIAGLVGLVFRFASPLASLLGAAGIGVVTRVMGMLLAAIAMGMLADGLKGMLPGLAG
ncbi:MAG: MarC family protein [Pseudomonadota bacterium]